MASEDHRHRVINLFRSDESRVKMIVRPLEGVTAAHECELRVSYLIRNKDNPDEVYDFGCEAFELRRLSTGKVEGLENVKAWMRSKCIFDNECNYDRRYTYAFVEHIRFNLDLWPRANVITATMVVDEVEGEVGILERVGVYSGECSVCLEEFSLMTEALRMPCSHTFHHDRIFGWLNRDSTCPMCRFQMPTESEVVVIQYETTESEVVDIQYDSSI